MCPATWRRGRNSGRRSLRASHPGLSPDRVLSKIPAGGPCVRLYSWIAWNGPKFDTVRSKKLSRELTEDQPWEICQQALPHLLDGN